MLLQLFEEEEQPMIRHSLRVEDAVEVIILVLHDPSVKALYFALDDLAVETGSPVADAQVPRHDAAQPRNREAALPAERAVAPEKLDHWVD